MESLCPSITYNILRHVPLDHREHTARALCTTAKFAGPPSTLAIDEVRRFKPSHSELVQWVSEHAQMFWRDSWIHHRKVDATENMKGRELDFDHLMPVGPWDLRDVKKFPGFIKSDVPSILNERSRMNVSLPFWYKHRAAFGPYSLGLDMRCRVSDIFTYLDVSIRELVSPNSERVENVIDFELSMYVNTSGFVFYDDSDDLAVGTRKWRFSYDPHSNSIQWKVNPRVEEHEGNRLCFPPLDALLLSESVGRGDWETNVCTYADDTRVSFTFGRTTPAHVIVSRDDLAAFLCTCHTS